MTAKSKYISYILIGLTILSFVTAYFVKPHAFDTTIVAPESSIARNAVAPPHNLADRVAKSYNLAFVIVKSEFSDKNANALESLRNWASKNFQHDPNFLHPASLERRTESNQSIIDSFSYSILATTHYLLEQCVASFLQWRIHAFHGTHAYESFRNDFYNVFGQDTDSATLLARYQSHRAQQAIDPLLGASLWLILAGLGLIMFFRGKSDDHAGRGQRILASTWLALALFYIVSAWIQNQVPILISAIVCGAIGLYLQRPVKITYGENHGLNLEWIRLGQPTIALLYWITISMLLIRIVSWIKTGSLLDPDPVTLVVSSFTGDFLHDPAEIKRNIDRWVGVIWTLFTLWTIFRITEEADEDFEWEEDLSTIQKSFFQSDVLAGQSKMFEHEHSGEQKTDFINVLLADDSSIK
jgi:hypothetical protein